MLKPWAWIGCTPCAASPTRASAGPHSCGHAGRPADRRTGRSRSRRGRARRRSPRRTRPAARPGGMAGQLPRLGRPLDPGDAGAPAGQRQRRERSAAPQPLAHRASDGGARAAAPWSVPAGRRPSGRPRSGQLAHPRSAAVGADHERCADRPARGQLGPAGIALAPQRRRPRPARKAPRPGMVDERLAAEPWRSSTCSTPTPNGPLPCAALS